jgi:hypothetical protein
MGTDRMSLNFDTPEGIKKALETLPEDVLKALPQIQDVNPVEGTEDAKTLKPGSEVVFERMRHVIEQKFSSLDTSKLPDRFKYFVESIAGYTQTGPKNALACILGFLSRVCLGRFKLFTEKEDGQPLVDDNVLSLIIFYVAYSGRGKTSVSKKFTSLFSDHEQKYNADILNKNQSNKADLECAKSKLAGYKACLTNLTRKGKSDDDPEVIEVETKIKDITARIDRLALKNKLTYVMFNATPESYPQITSVQPDHTAGVWCDERSFLDLMTGKYNNSVTEDFLIKGWDGSPYSQQRRGNTPADGKTDAVSLSLQEPELTFFSAIQPEPFNDVAKVKELSACGFLARSIVFADDSKKSPTNSNGASTTFPTAFTVEFESAFKPFFDIPAESKPIVPDVSFETEAKDFSSKNHMPIYLNDARLQDMIFVWAEGIRNKFPEDHLFRPWVDRLAQKTLRISALIHICIIIMEHGFIKMSNSAELQQIGIESVTAAMEIMRVAYVDSKAYLDTSGNPAYENPRQLLDFIMKNRSKPGKSKLRTVGKTVYTSFTLSQLQACFEAAKGAQKSMAEAAVAVLIDHGYLRAIDRDMVKTTSAGNPGDGFYYLVNPDWIDALNQQEAEPKGKIKMT